MRSLIEKMERLSREQDQRDRKRGRHKTRKSPPADVVCALCGKTVPFRTTSHVEGLGRACKSHPGVS